MASRPPLDPLDVLRSARDSMRRLQELASKLSVPVEQRRALTEGLSRMVMPGEQLQAMVDLADAFGPAHTQIAEIRSILEEQRGQIEQMLVDLEHLDEKVARLAAASEQISAMQEPFRILLRRFEGQGSGDDGPADAASSEGPPTT